MPELDHVFLPATAKQAQLLSDFGLSEAYRREHAGQGTANVCFCFANAFLELLYITDSDAVQQPTVAPLRLFERLSGAPATCPFGICLRSADGGPVFDDYAYPLDGLPPGARVDIAQAGAEEPLWFSFAPSMRPDQRPAASRPPLTHRVGLGSITRVTLASPAGPPRSPASQLARTASPGIDVIEAPTYSLTLGFDQEKAGLSHDFSPALPLKFCW